MPGSFELDIGFLPTTWNGDTVSFIADTRHTPVPSYDSRSSRPRLGPARVQSHTKDAWESIKPIFVELYIDSAVPLKEVMQRLRDDYGFAASEPMYKKRIARWGLSKNMKADKKDVLITKLLQEPSSLPTTYELNSRPDKIIRRARGLVKAGTLSRHQLNGLTRETHRSSSLQEGRISSAEKATLGHKSFSGTTTAPLTRLCLALPDSLKAQDQLLWSLKHISLGESAKFTKERFELPIEIQTSVEDGMNQWEMQAFSDAKRFFNKAYEAMVTALRLGRPPELIMLRYMTPGWCLRRCIPFYVDFMLFVAKAVTKHIGKDHPFTQIARLIQELSTNPEAQIWLWDCILGCLDVSSTSAEEWGLAALSCIRVYNSYGFYQQAAKHCEDALGELRQKGLLSIAMEIKLYYEQAKALEQNNEFGRAILTFMEVVRLTTNSPDATWNYNYDARRRLANICEEVYQDVPKARSHLTEAFLYSWGVSHSDENTYLYAFHQLWKLCQRHHLDVSAGLPLEGYQSAYNHTVSLRALH